MKHFILAFAIVSSLLVPLAASAQRSRLQCSETDGDFTSVLITDPALCDSPIGMCTSGQLEGGLEGTYEFTFLSMVPDAVNPSITYYTGRSVITTDAGHLYGEDTGVMQFNADGTAAFVTRVTVFSGDGCFRNASGRVVAEGNLDLASGNAVGTYVSELCGRAGYQQCLHHGGGRGHGHHGRGRGCR